MRIVCIVLLLALALQGRCDDWKRRVEDPKLIHECVKKVTDVIVYDIFSPPVASRIYAYITIAGYEAARQGDTHFTSLAGRLHGLGPAPEPGKGERCSYPLAAVGVELDAISAVVIGGTLLTGGYGFVLGTFIGVMLLGLVQTYIIFDGTLSSWWTKIVIGALLFLFIVLQRLIFAASAPEEKSS